MNKIVITSSLTLSRTWNYIQPSVGPAKELNLAFMFCALASGPSPCFCCALAKEVIIREISIRNTWWYLMKLAEKFHPMDMVLKIESGFGKKANTCRNAEFRSNKDAPWVSTTTCHLKPYNVYVHSFVYIGVFYSALFCLFWFYSLIQYQHTMQNSF